MEFHEKLKKLRKEQSMSQEEFSQQLNVSRQAVSKWESGQGFPETDKLLMMSSIFDVSLDYLLKDNDQRNDIENESGYYVNREMVYGYLAMKKQGAKRIALGVFVIVVSLAFTMVLEDEMGTFLFLGGVATGIAILVLQGFQPKRYEEVEKQPLIFDQDFLRKFQVEYFVERKKYGIGIVTGIMLILASCATSILIEDILKLSSQYEAMYPVFWATGIAFLIINGSALNAYHVMVKNKEHMKELTQEQRFSWVFGVGFLLATAIFLVLGIVGGMWNPGWLVFPVTGLICAAISVGLNSK